MNRLIIIAAVTILAGCGAERERRPGTTTCSKPCGDLCCTSSQTCDEQSSTCVSCTPASCGDIGATCGSPSDGCGGTLACGDCDAGSSCNAGTCISGSCTPKSCAELGANCGAPGDGCGTALSCGNCPPSQTCGAGGPFVCGTGACVAENDRDMCARVGKDCGAIVEFDNCGNSRSIASCGGCNQFETCGEIVPNRCGCVPSSVQTLCRANEPGCGTVTLTDDCGQLRTLDCGECGGPIGTLCSESNECESNMCFPLGDTSICTSVCSDGEPCPAGSTCAESLGVPFCLVSCQTTAQCGHSGLACNEGFCVPAETVEDIRFMSCDGSTACPDELLCVSLDDQSTSGACYSKCENGTPCLDDEVCLSETFCVPTCSDGECPGVTWCDANRICAPPQNP